MRLFSRSPHPRTRLVAELVVVALGLLALVWAWRADLRYCERHLLLGYVAADPGEDRVAANWRLGGVVAGAVLLLIVRPLVGRWAGRQTPREALGALARIGVSLVLSLVASEIGLRILHLPKKGDRTLQLEVRIGQPDPRYGWLFEASKSTVVHQGYRDIRYDIDADHDRVRALGDVVDPAKPTIFFVGESIIAGHGLHWEETLPALVGAAFDTQVVNLGVHGYGSDQAFLRLIDALPKFQHPVAVVTFFISPMVQRVDNDDHPHLFFEGDTPVLAPATTFWRDLRVTQVSHRLVPYHGDQAFDLVAKIFRETDARARARGAKALFVAPQFNHDVPRRERWLVDELITSQGLHVVDVDFGFEALPADIHPDVASTRRLAEAVVLALRTEIAQR